MEPELHFDATTIEGLSDDDPVASWADLSGNERDLSQAEEAKQPLLKLDALNGRPVVRFDGEDDFLKATGFELTQPNIVSIVGTNNQFDGGAFIDGSKVTARHFVNRRADNKWGINAGSSVVSEDFADGDPHLFTAVFDGEASSLRVDGVTVAEGNPGAQTLGGAVLGSRYDGAANFLTGDIAEVRVYHEMSAQERSEVEAILLTKWFQAPMTGALGSPGRPLSRHNPVINP